MKITEQDLKNISLLSKIKIDEETSDSLIKDLESILTMVNKMDELDTSKINPLTHPIENTQTLREDIEKKDIEREFSFKIFFLDVFYPSLSIFYGLG